MFHVLSTRLAVEATGPPQRGVDRIGPVRRANDDDGAARVEPVHQREQRRDDRRVDLSYRSIDRSST